MDYEISSAAVIVPRIGERISHSLNSLKDRFLLDDTPPQQAPVSPLFQSIEEACPTDIINFHHEEEVVETKIPPPTAHLPIYDLDSVDANDLFSFFLDNSSPVGTNLSDAKPADIPTTLPGSSPVTPCDQLPADLDIPLDLLDLLDTANSSNEFSPQTRSTRHESDSSSDPAIPMTQNLDDNLSCCSDTDYMERFDLYGSGDEEYIERAVSSKKRGRGSNHAGASVYLHNEDLVRGKPGQRLVLTAEEKRLLVQMGQRVPTTFPLTRSEERAIRTMRRKIRNKLSAKASRARRQEYLSNLESRVADCHKENQRLRNRITELEKDKRGLLANLRQMRSYMARLISGTYSASLKSNTATPPQPLLPLTIPKQRIRDNHGGRFTGAGTGLLVIALMILASSTLLPLPDVDGSSSDKDASRVTQSVLSGRSRLLLNSKTEGDVVVDSKDDNQQLTLSAANGVDGSDDDIPVITSKVRILNKGPEQKIIQSLELDDQLDPFLAPPNIGVGRERKDERHVPYSTEDL